MSAKLISMDPVNFNMYNPDSHYVKREKAGIMSHSGPALKPINSKLGNGSWDFNFDHSGFYERLIVNSWKSAVVPTGPRSHGGMLGGHRGNSFKRPGSMPPLPSIPGARAMPALPAKPNRPYQGAGHMVKPPVGVDQVTGQMAPPPAHLKGYAKDWSLMKDIPRVDAYGFRGDSRGPDAIRIAKGFAPPATRTDEHYLRTAIIPNFKIYMKERFNKDIPDDVVWGFLRKNALRTPDFVQYEIWRAIMDQEKYHLGRMISNEALKGYTSTSKSPNVAKAYAKPGGYVYVLKVTGAFIVPMKGGGHQWTGNFAEEEMAMPGPVPWVDDVVAYRKVGAGTKFTGAIYLRNSFIRGADKKAAHKVMDYLSGKTPTH